MLKIFSATATKFARLQTVAVAVQSGNRSDALQALHALQSDPDFAGKAWQASFAKLGEVISTNTPRFSVFKLDGNIKLPFVAFSSLPAVTCPGAGDCLSFCYSFRAWRYPAAFARQAQNAWLMRSATGRKVIRAALFAHAGNMAEAFDFRLYVDGDFSSVSDVEFWFDVLNDKRASNVRAYGYSKSFDQILAYRGQWPTNYMLNVSSGHRHNADTVARMHALPITRGEFRAVSIGRTVKSIDHGKPETNAALRAASVEKIFPCPGKCGSCTGAGHACGLPALRGRVIAIAVH